MGRVRLNPRGWTDAVLDPATVQIVGTGMNDKNASERQHSYLLIAVTESFD